MLITSIYTVYHAAKSTPELFIDVYPPTHVYTGTYLRTDHTCKYIMF